MSSPFTIDIEKLPADTVLPSTLPRLFWHFIRQCRLFLVIWIVLNTLTAALNAMMPWFGGHIVDALNAAPGSAAGVIAARPLLAGFAVVSLVLPVIVGNWEQYLLLAIFAPRFVNLIRRQTHWYTLQHSIGYFHDDFAGRIANKVQQLGGAVRDVVTHTINAVLYVGAFILSAITLMAGANLWLIVPMVVWMALYVALLWRHIPRVEKKSVLLYDTQSTMVGRLVDSYTNISTVKLFARKAHEDNFVVDALHAHTDATIAKNREVFWLSLYLGIVNSLMMGIILALSVWLWSKGAITPGQIAMIVPLAIQINNQLYWILWEMTLIFEQVGAAGDSMKTLSRPHTVTDVLNAAPLAVRDGAIDFDAAEFHYGKGDGLFDRLTLHIPAGQKVGLVGHSGAGKSTLVNLLLRFHDLESGRILIDGQNIADVTQDSLRGAIGMVTQDTSLLHRSILDNIRYGKPDASFEEVTAAAERAHAHEFILALQDGEGRKGYEALVGERGVKLSGGQRQRIALARILLKNAPILIMDEATSALDSEVETYIQQHLSLLMEGKTVIAIAHRLSTIARMDRLIVMEGGHVIEDGTHEELLAQDGVYARLWKLQSGGFLPD